MSVYVPVLLPNDMVSWIDAEGRTRSDVIRAALEHYRFSRQGKMLDGPEALRVQLVDGTGDVVASGELSRVHRRGAEVGRELVRAANPPRL